jgi:CspA family cold shock protein
VPSARYRPLPADGHRGDHRPAPAAGQALASGSAQREVARRARAPHFGCVSLVQFGLLLSLLVIAERRARSVSVSLRRPTHPAMPRGGTLSHERDIAMAIGTVKWFNATKGYGFIQPDDGSKDVFLHISDVQRAGLQDPREGDKLEYDLQRGQQGKTSAGNLKLAS